MTRRLAGSFDSSGRTGSVSLGGTLGPDAASIVDNGALRVAYTGPAPGNHSVLCLLDGFLDNAAELRVELDVPTGATPEDVLAAGYRRWGRGLPAHMRGDFVLLIWDRERDEGLIARDQLGVRSLFLCEGAGDLRFATEIRHLLALLPRRPKPDPVSVAHWIAMSNRPGAATLYDGIRRLNPGAMLLLSRHGMREAPYWKPRFAEPLDGGEPQLAEAMRMGIDRAVRRRIGADGLTAVLMSGGLDSASVAAVAATAAPERVCACAAVFPEHPAVDESALIDELRSRLGLGGFTAEVRPGGLVASAIDAVETWEVPLLGWGDFYTLPLLHAAAAAGVRRTLGGDGGDELFGARFHLLADRLRAGHPIGAIELARELPGAGDRPPRRQVARIVGETAVLGALPYRLHETLRRPFARREAPAWLRKRALKDLLTSDDPLAWKRLEGPRWWADIAFGLTRGIEETGIFEHQRRRAASAGLQARHPLFDLDLLELALRQPPLATFDRYRNRPVLRAAMAGLLPDAVRLRPGKAWFDSVIVDSLTGPDNAALRRLLSGPGAELGAYVDMAEMQRMLIDPGPGADAFRWMHQVWRLATAEIWLRQQAGADPEALRDALRAPPPQLTLRSLFQQPLARS